MDDWEDDLLALAEAPVPKKKKKDKKKRKRESSGSGSDMELAGSGSDMDLQGSSDEEGSAQGDDNDGDELRPEMFPVEGIYKSTQERADFMEMTEIDRELILEERREKLQKYQDRQLLKQMVADQDGGGASGGSDDEDSRPRTRRKAPVSKRAKQLEELKQRRKSKSEREEKRAKKRAQGSDYDSDEENKGRRSPSVPIYTDSEDEDGEYEKEQKPSAKKKGKSREPADLQDIRKICLPRAVLAKYWPCPWFGEYVEGAYVRMGVGQEKGEPVYRLAKVEKVAETASSRLYKLDNNVTNLKLTLIIGEDRKDMTMEMVSNSAPSDREINRYFAVLKSKNLDVPTKLDIEAKLESLNKYKDAILTEHDISLILAKKKEYAKGNLHDRHTLRNERDIAIRAGNVAEVARLDEILADMDGKNQSQQSNGSTSATIQNKGPLTLEDRRRNLAMASMAVGTPKAVAGKTASPAMSRPASGTTTPQKQPSFSASQEVSKQEFQNGQAANESQKQNKFQKLLASKVDIDLGDF